MRVKRTIYGDKISIFQARDKESSVQLCSRTQLNCSFKRFGETVQYYNLVCNAQTGKTTVLEYIFINKELQVNLNYKNNCEPLPKWVLLGHSCKLKRFSMLENFSLYIRNRGTEFNRFFEEVNNIPFYFPRGHPKYSTALIIFNEFPFLFPVLGMVPYIQIMSSLLMKCICKKYPVS